MEEARREKTKRLWVKDTNLKKNTQAMWNVILRTKRRPSHLPDRDSDCSGGIPTETPGPEPSEGVVSEGVVSLREGLRTEPHISRLAMLSIVLMRVIYDPSTRTVSGSSRGSPAESSRGIPSCVSRVIRETRVRNADAKSWRSFDGAAMWRWKLDGRWINR